MKTLEDYCRIIPQGVKVTETGEWQYSNEIILRETPGNCAAHCQLEQICEGVGDDLADEMCIELTIGQLKALRDYTNVVLKELGEE